MKFHNMSSKIKTVRIPTGHATKRPKSHAVNYDTINAQKVVNWAVNSPGQTVHEQVEEVYRNRLNQRGQLMGRALGLQLWLHSDGDTKELLKTWVPVTWRW